jgi:hypothetical protein
MKLLISNFLYSPVTYSLIGPYILLIILFSNTLNLRSSLNIKNKVETSKIIVFYVLIFIFLDKTLQYYQDGETQGATTGWNVTCMGETRNAYRILVGKRVLGRPRTRWEYNIKIYLRDVG